MLTSDLYLEFVFAFPKRFRSNKNGLVLYINFDEGKFKGGIYLDGKLNKEHQIAGEILYRGADLWIGVEPGNGYTFGATSKSVSFSSQPDLGTCPLLTGEENTIRILICE